MEGKPLAIAKNDETESLVLSPKLFGEFRLCHPERSEAESRDLAFARSTFGMLAAAATSLGF
jgi:hypothetical protein